MIVIELFQCRDEVIEESDKRVEQVRHTVCPLPLARIAKHNGHGLTAVWGCDRTKLLKQFDYLENDVGNHSGHSKASKGFRFHSFICAQRRTSLYQRANPRSCPAGNQ